MTNVQTKVWLFPAILFFILACSSPKQPQTVAVIGTKNITLAEFRDMYQFNPSLAVITNDAAAKKLLLQSLIAEKILAEAATKKGLDESPKVQTYLLQFKREALIEKLWQDSIFNKIHIGQDELVQAYRQSKQQRVVEYLMYADSVQAASDYARLRAGMSFTRLARLKGFSPKTIPLDTILFDTRLPDIQPQVFRMKINEISPPVKEGRYYFILKLKNILTDVFQSQDDFNQMRPRLVKTLRLRKSVRRFAQFKRRHFKTAPYSLNKEVFKQMAQAMDAYLFSSGQHKGKKKAFAINLESNGPLGSLSQKVVVRFNNGTFWTVKMLLQQMEVAPYPVETDSRGGFRKSILVAAKHLLDDEALAQTALRLGLDKTNYVRNQQRMWGDYLLYELEKARITQNENTPQAKSRALLKELSRLVKQQNIHINYTILDTLSPPRANMFIFKTHFPERTIVPPLSVVALPDSICIWRKKQN